MKLFTNYSLTIFFQLKKLFLIPLYFAVSLLSAQTSTQTYTYTSSGAFTVPAGVTSITVECWGAGGKGGDSSSSVGNGRGGGGGGAYARSVLTVVPSTTYDFVVGQGGNSTSANGGDTYFGINLVRAQGGRGVGTESNNGASGGLDTSPNSIGQIRYKGGDGGNASSKKSGGGGGGAGSTGAGNNGSIINGGTSQLNFGGAGGKGGEGTYALIGWIGEVGEDGNVYGAGGGGSAGGLLSGLLQLVYGGNGANGLIRISYEGLPLYCIPSSSSATYYINNVSVQGAQIDFSNTSNTYSPGGYRDYSYNFLGQQFAGGGLNFSVELNNLQYLSAWIDWNRNGSFNDPGEQIYSLSTKIYSTVFGVVIPTSTPSGFYKVRIRSSDSTSSISPCGNLANGETEDYFLQVIPDCQAVITTVTNGSRCGSGAVTLSASASAGVTQYRWYDQEVGGVMIASTATGTWNTPSLTETKTYYVTAFNGTCETWIRTRIDAVVYSSTDVIVSPENPQFCREGDIVQLEVESYQSTEELINENFEGASFVFGVNTITNVNGIPWNLCQSVYTTTTTVWKPAIASGRQGNKFAFTSADVPSTNINTALELINSVSTASFSELTLTFRHYYSDYYSESGDYGHLEISTNGGSNWTIVHTFNSDQGIPSRFKTETFNFDSFVGHSQFKVRFRYESTYADGWAIDDIRLYGKKNLSVPIQWINSDNILYIDSAATTPYSGQNLSTVYAKPVGDDLTSENWSFLVESSLANGCVVQKEIIVTNNGRIWTGASTDWNSPSNWLPMSVPTIDNCVTVPTSVTQPEVTSSDIFSNNILVKTGANLTINSGLTAYVKEEVHVQAGAELVFENNASLLQYDDVSNIGNIIYKRNTSPMNYNDYTYWGTPVIGQITSNLFENPNNIFKWNASTQSWANAFGEVMSVGYGYIMRAPSDFPAPGDIKEVLPSTFVGVPNNGNVNAVVIPDPNASSSDPYVDAKMSFLSNPYPSAIDIDKFFVDASNSTKIVPTVYLWTHSTDPVLNQQGNAYVYVSNDFAVYNLLGGVNTQAAPNDDLNRVPTGKIASGQGFFIKGSVTGGTVTFKNAHRVDQYGNAFDNDEFYRINTTNEVEKNRLWLSIRNENFYKQTLIGYATGATNDLDFMDGDYYEGGNSVSIFTTLESQKKLVIQSRAIPFEDTDVVPVGIKISTEGTYRINLDFYDGLFDQQNENQNIYLRDNLLDIIHNLKLSPYEFYAEAGEYLDRFYIVYRVELNQPTFELSSNWQIITTNNTFNIISDDFSIKEVYLFNMQGKRIYFKENIDSNQHFIERTLPKAIYIVKILTTEGNVLYKKAHN